MDTFKNLAAPFDEVLQGIPVKTTFVQEEDLKKKAVRMMKRESSMIEMCHSESRVP